MSLAIRLLIQVLFAFGFAGVFLLAYADDHQIVALVTMMGILFAFSTIMEILAGDKSERDLRRKLHTEQYTNAIAVADNLRLREIVNRTPR